MSQRWHTLLATFVALPVAFAQTRDFGWSFAGLQEGTTTIAQCATLKVDLAPPNGTVTTTGTAPWTMLAFEGGKVPTSQVLGSNADELSWQVRHAPGAQLLVTMVDGRGNYGGFPAFLYTVGAGSSSSCMPSSDTSPSFSVVSNVTSSLSTCDPWGLTISGGTPPYSISIAAMGATVVTNVTGTSSQNRFTYINRASPQTPLIAGVSDSTGRWGVSSVRIATTGSSDVACAGAQSSWETVTVPAVSSSITSSSPSSLSSSSTPVTRVSSTIASSSTSSPSPGSSSSNTGAIAGGVVGGIAVLLLLGACLFFLRRRRRRARSAVTPYAGSPNDGAFGGVRLNAESTEELKPLPPSSHAGYYLHSSAQDAGGQLRSAPAPASSSSGGGNSINPPTSIPRTSASGDGTAVDVPAPASSRAARKQHEVREAAEAARRAEAARHAPAPPSPVAGASFEVTSPLTTRSEPDTIVVQHEDGGAPAPVVLELPPAYTDRRNPNSPYV